MEMLLIVFVTDDEEADKALSDDIYVPSEKATFVTLFAPEALRFASRTVIETVTLLAVAQEKLSALVSEVISLTVPVEVAFRKYSESFPPGLIYTSSGAEILYCAKVLEDVPASVNA